LPAAIATDLSGNTSGSCQGLRLTFSQVTHGDVLANEIGDAVNLNKNLILKDLARSQSQIPGKHPIAPDCGAT
jgi:hypothetical protein